MKELVGTQDGVLVQVEDLDPDGAALASSRGNKLELAYSELSDFARKVASPLVSVWAELNRDLYLREMEVTLSVGIAAKGGFFLAQGEASGSIGLKLLFTAPPSVGEGAR